MEIETCPRCQGDGDICETCDKPTSSCECDDEYSPAPCEECDGIGEVAKALYE